MQESELYQRWFSLAARGQVLHSGPHELQIMNSGEISLRRGPDIRRARFRLDGQIYHGEVEFHISPGDWYRHHHHLDRAYENVLLHVVARSVGQPGPVFHQGSGAGIPTLVLPVTPSESSPGLCPSDTESLQLSRILSAQAQRRFALKVRQYLEALTISSADQVFYQAAMRVWGYPHNAQTFELLSQRCTWSHIWSWLRRRGHDEQGLYALLAGTAGFLNPDVPRDDYTVTLHNRFETLSQLYPVTPLPDGQWVWAACRPVNHPHRRLAGMAALLSRPGVPFWQQAQEMLSRRLPPGQILPGLLALLDLPSSVYWQKHTTLGQCGRSSNKASYFGRARILEWLINALVPVVAARAALQGSQGYVAYLGQFWQDLPQPVPYGIFKKYPPLSTLPAKNFVGQGILQLRKEFCLAGRCASCPLRPSNKSLT